MGIIRAVNLIFDYIRHDEETDKDEVSHALRGVNLDIEEGSFVAILGHNGSGKSTFAKLMNGILLPSDGTVYISDMKTSDEEHLWDVRKTAGMEIPCGILTIDELVAALEPLLKRKEA